LKVGFPRLVASFSLSFQIGMSQSDLGDLTPAGKIQTADTATDEPTVADVGAPPLSKNAQKKAAKAARFAALKPERRAKEREARKEKRKLKRAAEDAESGKSSRKRAKVEDTRGPQKKFGARLVVDLGFDEMMTDKVCSFLFYWVMILLYYVLWLILCGGDSGSNLADFTVGLYV
jgi:hypothetical protein